MLALLFCCAPAHAEPWADPAGYDLARAIRDDGLDRFAGVGLLSPEEALLYPLPAVLPASVVTLWAPEIHPDRARFGWAVRPDARLSLGTLEPFYQAGDEEPGLLSVQAGVRATVGVGPWILRAHPELQLGVVPGVTPELRLPELWTGLVMRGWTVGFGKEARWVGPGRHGNLTMTDNAVPPWMGGVTADGHLPGVLTRVGRFRTELEVGWLDRPRGDVANPGLLLLDMRYLPIPGLEVGATRMSIFGGEGRPAVDLGQLILPTEPHIYEDTDQELPDQDELADLDVRVTLPLAKWFGGPVRHVEGWWEYGGEDVIGRDTGGIKLPALAGVGNLFGGEAAVGPVTLTGEYTKLMDDYFRWYVGHRVYHDGFTQDDRVLGHAIAGDAEDLWGALAVTSGPWRVRATAETLRRVGVIGTLNDHVFALPTEEHRVRVGVDGGHVADGRLLSVGLGLERYTGDDFTAGADGWRFRVALSASPVATWSGHVGRAAGPPPLPEGPPPLPTQPPPVPPPLPVPGAP